MGDCKVNIIFFPELALCVWSSVCFVKYVISMITLRFIPKRNMTQSD